MMLPSHPPPPDREAGPRRRHPSPRLRCVIPRVLEPLD
jgi:hypothetical protein